VRTRKYPIRNGVKFCGKPLDPAEWLGRAYLVPLTHGESTRLRAVVTGVGVRYSGVDREGNLLAEPTVTFRLVDAQPWKEVTYAAYGVMGATEENCFTYLPNAGWSPRNRDVADTPAAAVAPKPV
jgi:hypothetical protein